MRKKLIGFFCLRLSFLSISLLFIQLAKSQDFTTGLAAHYNFTTGPKDQSNNNPDAVVKESGYARDMHGYIEGSPTLIGNGYSIKFKNPVTITLPGWTYSVWFKLNGMPAQICEGDAFLLTNNITNYGDDVHLFVDDEDNAVKVFFENGFFKVSSGVAVQPGRWYHAVLRYTATTTDVFIDGDFKLSSSGRFTSASPDNNVIISSLYPGSTTKGRVFGNVDDIRMYNRVLTIEDIKALYLYEKNLVAPADVPDTVYIKDTIVQTVVKLDTIYITDTIVQVDTFIKHDTLVQTIVKLDTIILGGNCIIAPNPVTNGKLFLQTQDRPVTVLLYNSGGQLVRKEELSTESYINVSSFANGTYFIKAISSSGSCGKKIFISN